MILQRIFSPIKIIRTAPLDTSRIGWFYNLDWYLRVKDSRRFVDLYFRRPTVPGEENAHFLNLWKQHIFILPCSPVMELVHRFNVKFEFNRFVNPLRTTMMNADIGQQNLIVSAPPLTFSMSAEDLKYASKRFKKLGVSEPFVCFHNRDPSYLNNVAKGRDWSHHDYRDSSARNMSGAVSELVSSGFSCVRMGKEVSERMKLEGSMKVPMYAGTTLQDDLLDLYLTKNCHFFVTGDTGINILPYMFGKPIVFHNWNILANSLRYVPFAILIPKLYYWKNSKQAVAFRDLIHGNFRDIKLSSDLDRLGVISVENSEEDIKSVVIEMQKRLNNTWEESKVDVERQLAFWQVFGCEKPKAANFRIGSKFLEKYESLI